MTAPTTILWRARRKAWRHRVQALTPVRITLATLTALAALAALGHLAAPSLLIAPIETATPTGFEPRSAHVSGASALEASFWLTALAASVVGFRVMELLFRRGDIRVISNLPFPATTFFLDRLAIAGIEVAGWSLALGAFFLPLAWHGAPWAALTCALLPLLGLVATVCIGFGVQFYAGDADFAAPQGKEGRSRDGGYGGAGQVFLLSPGIALALVMATVLLTKLGLGEVLRLEKLSRPALLGLGAPLGASAVALFLGWRYARASYHRMLAGFREVDATSFNVELDYQQSAWKTPARLEALVPARARLIYRRHALGYGRKHALARYAYVLVWLGLGLGYWRLSAEAFPAFAALGAPLIALAMLVQPWRNLLRPGLATTPTQALPVRERDEDLAADLFAWREALVFTIPVALMLVGLRSAPIDAATVLLAGPALGLGAVLTRRVSRSGLLAQLGTLGVAALIIGASLLGPLTTLVVSAVAGILTLVLTLRPEPT